MAEYELKDSGKREEFSTGSRRDAREGKGRYDLISPIATRRLALQLERGAAKYGERNWEKGQPLMRYMESVKRHLDNWVEGMRDEDHLAAALFNVHALIHTEEMIQRGNLPKELAKDVPNYLPKPQKTVTLVDPLGKAAPQVVSTSMLDAMLKPEKQDDSKDCCEEILGELKPVEPKSEFSGIPVWFPNDLMPYVTPGARAYLDEDSRSVRLFPGGRCWHSECSHVFITGVDEKGCRSCGDECFTFPSWEVSPA